MIRFPFILALLASFALSAFSALHSSAQTLIVSEYYANQAFEYDLNGNPKGLFASNPSSTRFYGMAFNKGGYLYIADGLTSSMNLFSNSGALLGAFATGGNDSDDVAFDTAGNAYVTGYASGIVTRISPSGAITKFASMSHAYAMAFDKSGNLYVSDGDSAIRHFSPTGSDLGIFASGSFRPAGMAFDATGNLCVANFAANAGSNAIVRFAPDGTPLPSWGDSSLGTLADAKFRPDGNLYVIVVGGNVSRFSTNGAYMGILIPGLSSPAGLAFRPAMVSFPVTVSGTVAFEGIVQTAPVQNVTFEFRVFGVKAFAAQTVEVAHGGGFSLSNVPHGNYSLHIKGDKNLAMNVDVDATSGDVSGVTAALPAGDANNDNSVDSTDFGFLIGAFDSDSTIPGSGYDARADFNGDGFVDSTDFGLLIGNFNETGDN